MGFCDARQHRANIGCCTGGRTTGRPIGRGQRQPSAYKPDRTSRQVVCTCVAVKLKEQRRLRRPEVVMAFCDLVARHQNGRQESTCVSRRGFCLSSRAGPRRVLSQTSCRMPGSGRWLVGADAFAACIRVRRNARLSWRTVFLCAVPHGGNLSPRIAQARIGNARICCAATFGTSGGCKNSTCGSFRHTAKRVNTRPYPPA